MSGGFGPLQSGKAHWGAKHVASDFFESVLFAGWDPDEIVDGEAAAFPRQEKLEMLVALQALCLEQAEHAMTEEPLRDPKVEIREPRAALFALGLHASLPRLALAAALALVFRGDALAESAAFRWSAGCVIVHGENGRFVARGSDLYAQSEKEARSVCNAKDPVFIFGPNTLSSCEIVPMAADPESGPAFEYRFSHWIPPLVVTSLTSLRDFISTRYVAFCRAGQAELVRYRPDTVSASLQEAIRRSHFIKGYELVPEAPWEAFSSKQGSSVVLVPVRWWDHEASDDDPYLDDWSDRVPYVRLVVIRKETEGGARFELIGRLHPRLEVRNVADVDGDGHPEADILNEHGDGWEYWVSSLHPGNVDGHTLWFKYRAADWVRVGK